MGRKESNQTNSFLAGIVWLSTDNCLQTVWSQNSTNRMDVKNQIKQKHPEIIVDKVLLSIHNICIWLKNKRTKFLVRTLN